jgi:hypothetical protein
LVVQLAALEERKGHLNMIPDFTSHALKRCGERKIQPQDVCWVIKYGLGMPVVYKGQTQIHFRLRKDDVPPIIQGNERVDFIISNELVVITDVECKVVVTVIYKGAKQLDLAA